MSIVEIGALAIVDLYIFVDETNGDADEVAVSQSIRDTYKLDYGASKLG